MMNAPVYSGPVKMNWEAAPDPVIQQATDVIHKMVATTICGTDLHILKASPESDGSLDT